jgi:hypothetical protein
MITPVGFEGDTPVCCAGSYPVDGCLFVVLVATGPTQHRRGFGEAVTRKALYEGAEATGLGWHSPTSTGKR